MKDKPQSKMKGERRKGKMKGTEKKKEREKATGRKRK